MGSISLKVAEKQNGRGGGGMQLVSKVEVTETLVQLAASCGGWWKERWWGQCGDRRRGVEKESVGFHGAEEDGGSVLRRLRLERREEGLRDAWRDEPGGLCW